MRPNIFIVLLLLCVVALTGACVDSSDGSTNVGSIEWKGCGDGWQCATLEVPIDRTDSRGPTVSLAIERLPASNEAERIGPLFVNTGGPLPVLPSIRGVASSLSADVRAVFDIVAFDPRGLGASDEVECNFDIDDLFADVDYSPDDDAEFDALVAANEAFAAACAASPSADLLGHLDIATIATDMDDIRAAMGDSQLSYLGFSWGTYLGLAYAEQFPVQVRAMVLDGVIDPAASPREALEGQAVGFEESLDAFFEWCKGNRSCEFHPNDPRAAFYSLLASIDADPIPVGSQSLGPSEFDLAIASMLYTGQDGFPILAAQLAAAERGNANGLYQLYRGYVGAGGDPSAYQGFLALACGDVPVGMNAEELRTFATELSAEAPMFGATTAFLALTCAVWAAEGTTVAHEVTAPDAPPILVVGTTGDPATPYSQAVDVAKTLKSGVLVTFKGTRHTAYGASSCVDEIVNEYLLTLAVPVSGVECS